MKIFLILLLAAFGSCCDLNSPITGTQILDVDYDGCLGNITIPLHERYCGFAEFKIKNISFKFDVQLNSHNSIPIMIWDYIMTIHDHNYSVESNTEFSTEKGWPGEVFLFLKTGNNHFIEFKRIIKEI